MTYDFELEMKVRDYECDLQGIVNNANYQHYTEHTRHEFLRSEGVSFAELHERGIGARAYFSSSSLMVRQSLKYLAKTVFSSSQSERRPLIRHTASTVERNTGLLSGSRKMS